MNDRRIAAFLLLPALAACSWWAAGRPTGQAPGDLRFDHALHAGDFGMTCAECHGAVEEANSLAGASAWFPGHDQCADCHGVDNDAECADCHGEPFDLPMRVDADPVVAFSHQTHLGVEGMDCANCHAAVASSGIDDDVPSPLNHDGCFDCHVGDVDHSEWYAQANCIGCHLDFRQVPLEAVAEYDHGGDWISRHGVLAQGAGLACLQCHTESTCTECHSTVAPNLPVRLYPDRVGDYLVHRGDFLHAHAIEARADADLCLRCHQTSFCQDCHTASGLTLTAENPLLVHPEGWNNPTSPDFHGPPARTQVVACASCHDQGAASNCVECHRVGGVGGNPHPSSWDDRYELEDVGDNPMCQICHGL